MNGSKKGIAKEINLKELFQIVKKRLWIIIVITLLAGIGGYLYSLKSNTLLYESSRNIIISANAEMMKTLQVLIRDSSVQEKVGEKLGLDRSAEALANQISIQSLDNSQVVKITVIDTNPRLAADIANTTAEVYKEEIPKILNFNNVRILKKAKINPNPINDNQNRSLFIAIVFGMLTGIGLAFFLDSLDETVKSENDVENYLGLPVLGHISKINKKNIRKHNQQYTELESGGETVAPR